MLHDNDNWPGQPLRFLSVCSGIEAASVAWPQWQAVAFSEIEKFPSAVLAHHYPDVPNLGDFTKIDTTKLGRVDIFCGGTPCQAFSVAGLRGGLNDERGNLTLKFVELAHELAAGNGLRNVVWENVVGVLSDKGNAFGCFLGGLVGADAAIQPPTRGKWGSAGLVAGPKGRAAWRVCDAQYFGLAQRRRRVIVVADFGIGADPAEVLFEREGVQRHTPPRREARKDVAGAIAGGAGSGGGLGTDFDLDGGLIRDVSGTVTSKWAKGSGGPAGSEDANLIWWNGDKVSATITKSSHAQMMPDQGNFQAVVQSVAIRGREGGATAELGGEVATALRASQGGGDKPHVLVGGVPEVAGTMKACAGKSGGFSNSADHAAAGYMVPVTTSAVRRLTPVECERLMGFPDNYTAIPWRGKPADQCPDGPRYKALGNSWAVPLFAWLGRRIDMQMPRTAANDNKESARAA